MPARLSVSTIGWLLLVGCLLAAGFGAFSAPARHRAGDRELTYLLQAESLIRDGDRLYGEEDRARLSERELSGPAPHTAKVDVSLARGDLRFHRPWPYSLALAPFVALAPDRGPQALNLLLLVGLSVGLARWFGRDNPKAAPFWSVALFFGTIVWTLTRAVWPELFTAALLVGAYLLTGVARPRTELPQMARPLRSPAAVWRWLAIGALLAMAVLQQPLTAVLVPVFLYLGVLRDRELGWAPTLGGLIGLLLISWLLGGSLFPGVGFWGSDDAIAVRSADPIGDIEGWVARLRAVEAPAPVFEARLGFWNGLYALFGRHAGLLPSFAPAAVLALTAAWRRRSVWLAAGLFVVSALLLDPFNFSGGPETLGFGRLLPVVVLLFFSVRAPSTSWPSILALVLGVVTLWPLWPGFSEHPVELRGRAVLRPLAERLPYETSQRHLPAKAEIFSRLLLVRTANDGLEPSSAEGHLVLKKGREGELRIAAAGELAYLDLAFGADAASELEVDGATLENLLFLPGGGVTFRLVPDPARVRHRIWGREDTHTMYRLRISMPDSVRDQPFLVEGEAFR